MTEVVTNGDVGGRHLLIDFVDVDEKFLENYIESNKIFIKLLKVFDENLLSSAVKQDDNSFTLFVCSETFIICVCGFKEKNMITADIRYFSEHEEKEIEEWLTHEYRPHQLSTYFLERGNSSKSVRSDTKRPRKVLH